MKQGEFTFGIKDGIATALGYFAVAFTFGVSAISMGFEWWMPFLISATNLTGTGQFMGIDLMYKSALILEFLVSMLVINSRYALMSVTLSQKFSSDVKLRHRFLMAFGVTDENFAVAIQRKQPITFKYFMGMTMISYCGWVSGTLAGALLGNVLPSIVLNAFGISLYAMFIAIIVPKGKTDRPTLVVMLIAVAISVLFFYTPFLNKLSSGWVIIIAGVVSAVIGALAFPVKDEEKTTDTTLIESQENEDSKTLTIEKGENNSREIMREEFGLFSEEEPITEDDEKDEGITAPIKEVEDIYNIAPQKEMKENITQGQSFEETDTFPKGNTKKDDAKEQVLMQEEVDTFATAVQKNED